MNLPHQFPSIVIGFLGNIHYDTRTYNLRRILIQKGYPVRFIGFDWTTPNYHSSFHMNQIIYRLKKRRVSILFYLQFFALLFYQMIRIRSDIYWASDFYSLPACFIAAKLHKAKLFYDSREIYTEINGVQNRKWLKQIIFSIEKYIVHYCDRVIATGQIDIFTLKSLYGINHLLLLRNLPLKQTIKHPFQYKLLSPTKGKILLYQGTLVQGRGIDLYLKIIQQYHGSLVLLGGGEHEMYFRKMAADQKIINRVHFIGKIPQNQLLQYTAGADIGLAFIENISKNNELALPNKLFEYIMAGIPVIVSDLPQMKAVVEKYQIGAIVPDNNPEAIIQIISHWDKHPDEYLKMKRNCHIASEKLNYESEFSHIEPFLSFIK
ncbi:glycosyltransferase [bacterium]|nr:glycosyltransferase [bacterium]